MKKHTLVRPVGLLLLAAAATREAPAEKPLRADPPAVCDSCAEWNVPREPFRVFGNTYSVGVAGLGAVLVTSDEGHVLLDGGLQQSAPLIDASIRKLGFRTEDVRLILNSHAHFDHAGGIAALQRASGAKVAARESGARALERGVVPRDDPQFVPGPSFTFPSTPGVRRVADGETLRVGPLAITAHATPGHTPGGTTWTWRSCEGSRCLDIVYADSLTAVSTPGYRFTGGPGQPGIEEVFRRSIATVAALPCDILLAVHPSFVGMDEKLRGRQDPSRGGDDPFIDPQACRAYAEQAARRLDARVAEERR